LAPRGSWLLGALDRLQGAVGVAAILALQSLGIFGEGLGGRGAEIASQGVELIGWRGGVGGPLQGLLSLPQLLLSLLELLFPLLDGIEAAGSSSSRGAASGFAGASSCVGFASLLPPSAGVEVAWLSGASLGVLSSSRSPQEGRVSRAARASQVMRDNSFLDMDGGLGALPPAAGGTQNPLKNIKFLYKFDIFERVLCASGGQGAAPPGPR
jgi:hypothetical protein